MKKAIKVLISDNVSYKLRHLCKIFPADHWSGILLFSIPENTHVNNIEETIVTTEDIIPTHKYSLNERNRELKLIKYFNEKPHLMNKNWKKGYVCSHSYTDVFFTNIDLEELTNSAICFGLYFSLIVNNWGEKFAKLATANEKVKIYNCYIEETNTANYQNIDISATFMNSVNKMIDKKKHSIQITTSRYK